MGGWRISALRRWEAEQVSEEDIWLGRPDEAAIISEMAIESDFDGISIQCSREGEAKRGSLDSERLVLVVHARPVLFEPIDAKDERSTPIGVVTRIET